MELYRTEKEEDDDAEKETPEKGVKYVLSKQ